MACQKGSPRELAPFLCQNWQNDVPADDGREAIEAQEDEQYNADNKECVGNAVGFPC